MITSSRIWIRWSEFRFQSCGQKEAISFTVIRISLSSVLYNFVLFCFLPLFLIIDLECLVSTHGKRCSYIFVSSSPGLCSQPAGIVCENWSKKRCSRTQVGFVSVESSEQYPVTKHIVNKRFFSCALRRTEVSACHAQGEESEKNVVPPLAHDSRLALVSHSCPVWKAKCTWKWGEIEISLPLVFAYHQ